MFDVGRLDRSGRVGVATLLHPLGWQPADQIDLDMADASGPVTATPAGRHRTGGRGKIGPLD